MSCHVLETISYFKWMFFLFHWFSRNLRNVYSFMCKQSLSGFVLTFRTPASQYMQRRKLYPRSFRWIQFCCSFIFAAVLLFVRISLPVSDPNNKIINGICLSNVLSLLPLICISVNMTCLNLRHRLVIWNEMKSPVSLLYLELCAEVSFHRQFSHKQRRLLWCETFVAKISKQIAGNSSDSKKRVI